MLKLFARAFVGGIALLAASFQLATEAHAQGIVLPGVGPVNRSMSGVATAAPLDAAGAMHWNPATISALKGNELLFGVEFIDSRTELSSTLGAPVSLSGSTNSNSGVKTLPTVALVWKPDDSPWTFGLGALGIGGFGVDYAASTTNPILIAPPLGPGAGALYSRLGILQIVPTASLQVTDNLSVGFAPTATIADLQLDPFFGAPPDPATGAYPKAVNTRNYWGLGFQVGAYWTTDSNWNFGASYKSPQWFETFQFNSTTSAGFPQTLSVETQFPAIYSLGTSYTGIENLLLACDMRYIDYKSTGVFGDSVGFTPTRAATGLGWRSVFSFAAAAQYQMTDLISVRAGYMYNQNPIPGSATAANIQSSALYQHSMSLGASMPVSRAMVMHLSWVHSFELTSTGPYLAPVPVPPGSSVSIKQTNDAITAGLTVKF